jgi:sugar phosphate isomerase/epimerase
MKLIKNAGFDSVLLFWFDDGINETIGRKDTQLAYRNGLLVENAHLPFLEINRIWEDTLAGEELKKILLGEIRVCADFGIPSVVLHLSRGNMPPPMGPVGLNRFKELVDLAEKRGISIAFENLRRPDYLDYIFENISSPRIGVCYDSGHNHCFTPKRRILTEFRDKIIATHLHDYDGTKDAHMLPFDGTIDWNFVKDNLNLARLNGTLCLEVEKFDREPYDSLTTEEFLLRARERLLRLFPEGAE